MSSPSIPSTARHGDVHRPWLDEPAVALSDLGLATVAATSAGLVLLDLVTDAERAPVLWAWTIAYLAMAVAAAAGFAYHGFGTRLRVSGRERLWTLTLASLGLVSFAILISVALMLPDAAPAVLLSSIAAARLIAYLSRLRSRRDFGYAITEYGVALGSVVLGAIELWARGEPAASWMLAAAVVAMSAAVIQRAGRSLGHSWGVVADANTLFHVVQIASLLLALQGVRLLGSPPVAAP